MITFKSCANSLTIISTYINANYIKSDSRMVILILMLTLKRLLALILTLTVLTIVISGINTPTIVNSGINIDDYINCQNRIEKRKQMTDFQQ